MAPPGSVPPLSLLLTNPSFNPPQQRSDWLRNQRANAMSAVITFPADRSRQAAQREVSGSAEVIIFPGVRIERMAFDLSERLPAARNGSVQQTRTAEFDFY